MKTPESFAFPSGHNAAKAWITAAARAHRINRWSRAVEDWIINGSVPSHKRIVQNDHPGDRTAVEAVYESLKKYEHMPECGTSRYAWEQIHKWWPYPNLLFLPEDCECILDLFVVVGLAVRTTPNGDFGHAVYEYPQAPAEEAQAP
jgi:hypothetical protein